MKYIRENDIHEKYILNQLEEQEKQAYEAYLESNPEAREELEQTRKIVEGVRAAGTAKMRKEIAEQVEAIHDSKTDWSMLYKVAAVLFIFVLLPAIIYYHQNFGQLSPAEQTVRELPPMIEKGSSEEQSPVQEIAEPDADNVSETKTTDESKNLNRQTSSRVIKEKQESNISQQPGQRMNNVSAKGTGLVSTEKKSTSAKRNKSRQGAVESTSIVSGVVSSPESEELSLQDLETATKLDQALDKVSGAGINTNSGAAAGERMEAPSRSMGMDYIPSVRTLEFSDTDKPLTLIFHRTMQAKPYPDFLKIFVKMDSVNNPTITLYLPDKLHSVERQDLSYTWENDSLLSISFENKVSYQLKLVEGQKVARKIK